jgi:DNA helicase-2/ATP-dependent DNA helicase PcrA
MQDLFLQKYNELNENQKKAVDKIYGPVLVLAGPGTGKTQVLALRIANILRQTGDDPKSILCLTFQESSVFAMQKRLEKFIGAAAYKVQISTFHSFCSEIIRTFPELFDFSDKVEPIKDIDKLSIFADILESESLISLQMRGDKLGYFKGIVDAISNLKKEFISPNQFLEIIRSFEASLDSDALKREQKRLEKLYDLQKFYVKYLEVMQNRNLIDFDDMIFRVTEQFSINESLVKFFQEKYLYTLVDEFQDTNNAQLEVLKAVARFEYLDTNVFAVGDDDQTIFRFQGVNSKNFERFLELFPKSEIIVLQTNYRSKQEIIDAASNLIANNPNRLVDHELLKSRNLNKNFTSGCKNSDFSDDIEVHIFEHSFHEDYWIGQKILELSKQGIKLNDIAIIVRKNNQMPNITKFLDRFGIPYTIKRSESLLASKYIRHLLLIVEVIASADALQDDNKMWQLLSLECFGFNAFDVLELLHKAKKSKVSIYDFVVNDTTDQYQSIREVIHKLIALQNYALNNSFAFTFVKIIHTLELLKFFEKLPDPYVELNKISSLYQYIQSRTNFLKKYSIHDFLTEVKLMEDRDIPLPVDPIDIDLDNKVNIITAHSAKGLEFRKVFIYQAVENKWEKYRGLNTGIKLPPLNTPRVTNDTDSTEIDERRLFYVAVTRGKDSVYITYSKRYFDADTGEVDTDEKTPSRFISEMNVSKHVEHTDLVQKHLEITKLLLEENSPLQISDQNKSYLRKLITQDLRLSATRINKYQKCHYKFLLEDIYKVPVYDSVHAILGNLVHDGIRSMYIKRNHGRLNDDALFEIINSQIQNLQHRLDLGMIIEEQTSYDVLKNDLEKSLKIYYEYLLHNPIKYLRSEQWIRGVIDGIKIIGRIDLLAEDEFGLIVIDFKTSQNIPSIYEFLGLGKRSDKTHLRQILFYKLLIDSAINHVTLFKNKSVNRLRLEYIDIKAGTVKVIEVPTQGIFEYKLRSNSKTTKLHDIDMEIKVLEQDLKMTYESILSFDFSRTEDRGICKNCPFRNHCGR